jgi:hypothetical protein
MFADIPVYWSEFSWEAFATLATGLAAVVAAYLIGRRQVQIQQAQTYLQERSLRFQLLDRRYSVFDRAEALLLEIVRTGHGPSRECERSFLIAKGEARFLFDTAVLIGLDEIWEKSVEYDALCRKMETIYREHGHYGEGNPRRKLDQITWISNRLATLPKLFDSMKLASEPLNR